MAPGAVHRPGSAGWPIVVGGAAPLGSASRWRDRSGTQDGMLDAAAARERVAVQDTATRQDTATVVWDTATGRDTATVWGTAGGA